MIRHIDTKKFDVTLVSPRNYFLMTALLPGVTVGTVEARSIVAPMREMLMGKGTFYEAAAVSVDPSTKTVMCRDDSAVQSSAPAFELRCCPPALNPSEWEPKRSRPARALLTRPVRW